MKKHGSDIPDAEFEVLRSLWRLGSGTVRDVLDDLGNEGRHPAYTTVMTLLGRLETRGYVQARRDSLAHVYRPRISKEKVMAERLGSLVKQLGDGQAAPLILQLVEAHKLSAKDIRRLREFLDKLEVEAGEEKV